MDVLKRFLEYVKFDTMSNENSLSCPSTKGQMIFAKYIVEELKKMGLKEITLDKNGYVMATLPSNVIKKVPTVGFIAHMDTSDAMSGKDVNPKIVKYVGNNIVLNKEKNIILSKDDFPEINEYINQELIVTDGTTLLGADDKAGIAEILTAIEYLIIHDEVKHGDLKIGLTPDEEIGRGAHKFDVKRFGADFAYTIDGGIIGELQYETFNAASVKINVKGNSVHPGTAKNKLINAAKIASYITTLFPKDEVPEKTEGYEGFYHLITIEGNSENASLSYIIRDFDKKSFESRKQFVLDLVENLNKEFKKDIIEIIINDQYFNMGEKIKEAFYIVDIAKKTMEEIGIEPKIVPVRGGTDGSNLSFMGLPTPNIFTGGHNFHGKYEYIPIKSMEKAVDLIIRLANNITKL